MAQPEPIKPTPHIDEHPELSARNARVGLWLFFVYSSLYAGFIGISCVSPKLMASHPFGGANLAILYGFGLIAAALLLALLYMFLCKQNADSHLAELARAAQPDEEPQNPDSPV
jgi:uncharacterized membrane protein (DUF485 family)